jgi:hypothetical protein
MNAVQVASAFLLLQAMMYSLSLVKPTLPKLPLPARTRDGDDQVWPPSVE